MQEGLTGDTRHLSPLKVLDNSFGRSSPSSIFDNSEAEASQTPPPHCLLVPPPSVSADPPPPPTVPSQLPVTTPAPQPSQLPLHCSSFLLLSEKSSNLTERGGLWLNSRDIRHFTTILLTRTPPCPASSHPELRHSPGPQTCQAPASSSRGEGEHQDEPRFLIVGSCHRPAMPHCSSSN